MQHPTNDDDAPLKEIQERRKAPYAWYESVVSNRVLHFYISDVIREPMLYTDMIHRIKTASPGDVIYINLNTPGGNLVTGVQLINAMNSTPAKVITTLESTAHSLGTLIFLSGDEYTIHENCLMLFHNYSGGTFGKGNEQSAQLDATIKWFNKLMKRICSPFLTEDEISRIIKGEDLWLDSDEIRKRLIKISKDNLQATKEQSGSKKRKG